MLGISTFYVVNMSILLRPRSDMFSSRAIYTRSHVCVIWFNSGEEETANLLLGKFKWGHAFLSLNRCVFDHLLTYLFFVKYEDTL
jgi:hypothetical protein